MRRLSAISSSIQSVIFLEPAGRSERSHYEVRAQRPAQPSTGIVSGASPVSFHQRQKVAGMATASAIVLTHEKPLDTFHSLPRDNFMTETIIIEPGRLERNYWLDL